MKTKLWMLVCAGLAALSCGNAFAATSMDSVRLGARDIDAAVRFYEAAFGLRVVERKHIAALKLDEVFLGFGEADKSIGDHASPLLILMERKADEPKDESAHLILRVSDIAKAVQSAKAAGGVAMGEPHPIPGGMQIAEVVDPAGNHLQLLQPADH